ncbi:SDR family NAD(P)-dependent oxidoreductase [Patescibacteria group bacterium]|nr:SDR family NAD(P)-dependent oxidoreductase [Patescibacteria group bacterium]
MANQNKTVLVTGGAGFIGSHLCERLLKDGARVVCIDNFSTSHVRNIEALLQNPNFFFLRLDVNVPFNLEKMSELEPLKIPYDGIQEIYHLACPTTIKKFDEFKIQTLLSNSVGNYHVLEIATKYKSKILLASTSVIYGSRSDDELYFEEDFQGVVDHLSPRACYDEGKRFSETMFETYRQVHGLETKIARIFRTYGPRMPLFDGHMIPDYVLNALENKDLVINGDESFSTSLVYITDVVDGLVRLMASSPETGPVNLGDDKDLKMVDVAKKIIELTGSTSKVKFEAPLPFLTELGLPRIARARELGWLPLVRLEDGLTKTIEDIRANKILLTQL